MSKDLTSKIHIKIKLFTHKLQKKGSVLSHVSSFQHLQPANFFAAVSKGLAGNKSNGSGTGASWSSILKKKYNAKQKQQHDLLILNSTI
jgi:hypothetical protein